MAKTTPPPAGASGTGTDLARRQAAQQCFARGVEVFKKGDFDYAVKLFKDACKLAPEQLVYRQHLRVSAKKKFDNNKRGSRLAGITTVGARASLKAARANKNWHKALECCEDCLSENPWDAGILLDEAGVFERMGLMDHAVWCGEGAMERDPADPTVNRALALIYEKHGSFTKAIDCWERVKKARPADEEADRRMKDLAASATIDRGGYEGAQSFTRAVADKTKTQELLDESKGGLGESKHAAQIAELEQKIRSQPTVLSPYIQLSQIYRRQGKLDKAREVMGRARDATGSHADAVNESEEIEIDIMKQNLTIAEKLAKEKPGDAEAQKKVQEHARTLNDFELGSFQRRCERNPTDSGLRVDLGMRLAKAGNLDEAITELQKARTAPGRKLDALIWLGHCFHAKKNTRLARRHYEEALEGLNASDQKSFLDLHYQIGRVCEDMGDKAEAIKHYDEVQNIEYTYRDVAQRQEALARDGGASSG